MTRVIPERERAFLLGRRTGHLATADARGAPHVVPVGFALGKAEVYIGIDGKPKGSLDLKRVRNIRENPTVALVADHYDEDWSRLGWVMLRGVADILVDGEEQREARALLRARYPQYLAEGMMTEQAPIIAVRVERIASWENWSDCRGNASLADMSTSCRYRVSAIDNRHPDCASLHPGYGDNTVIAVRTVRVGWLGAFD